MTSENFIELLDGFFKLTDERHLSTFQLTIKNSLKGIEPIKLVYGLLGYYELTENTLSSWDISVRKYLSLVVNKVMPNYDFINNPRTITPSIFYPQSKPTC